MKLKRSGIVLKIVVLAIILYAGFILVNLCGRIDDAKTTLNSYQQQASELEISNASVSYAIEHSEDESVLEQIARERLGYVYRNETIYTYE
ncbi:MAG: septum formation initiator family protein [Oscillospiraceae bacterium]|nr:septum formation initiator family protein [Oscillospiraceae bacterium]